MDTEVWGSSMGTKENNTANKGKCFEKNTAASCVEC